MVAGAIFNKALKPDKKNWHLLPDNKLINVAPEEWVFEGISYSERLLLKSIPMMLNPPHSFPFSGGYLEQPNEFHEAVNAWEYGQSLYAQKHSQLGDTLKQLAGKK